MFFSKLLLVFLATILGTSCGAWNGYPYPQSNGPSENSYPQLNGLQGYPYPQSNGPCENSYPQLNGQQGYPYPQSDRESGYPY
ncbi:hypothetical protein KQX54_017388 [Cotesia glomerata]|uniref:Uncharacterized protein n=1 Tax=Cotesia glomerata TaxID=32391 RepID=A0AAV7I931_COTGL|nr:hypothetical protein KQX54_017388 [Cotesia glomerata]